RERAVRRFHTTDRVRGKAATPHPTVFVEPPGMPSPASGERAQQRPPWLSAMPAQRSFAVSDAAADVEADFGADRQQLNIRAARTYIAIGESEDSHGHQDLSGHPHR